MAADQPSLWEANVHLPGLRPGEHLTIQQRYDAWRRTRDGRQIFAEVVQRALRLKASGFKHYAIGGLWEDIRFDYAIQVGPEGGFKLNDHFRSRMAREVMAEVPELRGFFELRGLRA